MKLAQIIQVPHYDSDPKAAPIFSKFITLFTPDNVNFSLANLVYRILLFAILAAGLVFFGKLLLAGYGYLTSAGDSAKIQTTTKNITNASIGLVIVISSFFIAQIIEVVFGIKFLL